MAVVGSNMQSPWVIQGTEKSKYENIFESLGPVSGKLAGDKVKPVLLNSKLPVDVLGRVWELSDIDNDGFLDKEEFCVAMYLVYRAIEKDPVPSNLPADLIPPTKRPQQTVSGKSSSANRPTDHIPPGAVSVLPPLPSSPAALKRHGSISSSLSSVSPKHTSLTNNQASVSSNWVVSQADKIRFTGIFQQNKDPDNFINGVSARNVFVQSGLSQTVLAHVWNMCDQQQIGRLTQDQFVLAMHLISQKVKGVELPTHLTPEMITRSNHDSGFGDTGSMSDASSGIGDTSAMRELDALNQEIEELRREKEALTTEIQQKELAIKTASHEVQELQDTLDRDNSSLAQLECDKAEAHTRLEELEQQRNNLDTMLADVRLKVQEENENIKSLKAQIAAQEASVSQQEQDLRRVRSELTELKQEETQLEQRLEAGKQQQKNVDRSVKEVKGEIEKVQEQLHKLQEQQKSVNSNIEQYDKAVAALKSESDGDFKFNLDEATLNSITVSESVFSMGGMQENVEEIKSDLKEDPFKDDPFKNADPFGGSDPFGEADPFASTASTSVNTTDPFAGSDPFNTIAPSQPATSQNDPFKTSDSAFGFSSEPFGNSDAEISADPFAGQDPFASSQGFETGKSSSAFATDPFASTDAFSKLTSDKPSSDAFADMTKPTNETTTNETKPTQSLFDSGAFANAFQDTDNKDSSLFKDFDAFSTTKETTSSTDPWGSAFGGGEANSSAGNDPFGGDAFGSDTFGSDPFSSQATPSAVNTEGDSKDKQAPPRPHKPSSMSFPSLKSSKTKTDTKPKDGLKKTKHKQNAATEEDQLKWAQEESKREQERRFQLQKQEEADLALAIALSKQDGK
ncbi:unnamed protein product [Clavelina lepadiformis]|uniref:Epidermal growth factor receptor substrate 15-like 1 n=1 Tax=Clavelina lepadiformis TaxID=159417 RepID=A0ABP0GHE0_CLALP